jgi:hypothetical protein
MSGMNSRREEELERQERLNKNWILFGNKKENII